MSYSKDYRKRTIEYRRTGHTQEETHETFKVSISTQKKLLTKVAKEKGYTNLVHFYDDGISGVTMDRPGFIAMIQEIEKGKAAAVFVKDMSRIGRDYLQTGFYTEVLFREKGVRFIAVASGVDSAVQNSSEFAPFLNVV